MGNQFSSYDQCVARLKLDKVLEFEDHMKEDYRERKADQHDEKFDLHVLPSADNHQHWNETGENHQHWEENHQTLEDTHSYDYQNSSVYESAYENDPTSPKYDHDKGSDFLFSSDHPTTAHAISPRTRKDEGIDDTLIDAANFVCERKRFFRSFQNVPLSDSDTDSPVRRDAPITAPPPNTPEGEINEAANHGSPSSCKQNIQHDTPSREKIRASGSKPWPLHGRPSMASSSDSWDSRSRPAFRVLCLHSEGSRDEIFRWQLNDVMNSCRIRAKATGRQEPEFHFMNAPHQVSDPVTDDLPEIFGGPYYSWYVSTCPDMENTIYDDVSIHGDDWRSAEWCFGRDHSINEIAKVICDVGPFDVVVGFGCGGAMASYIANNYNWFDACISFSSGESTIAKHSHEEMTQNHECAYLHIHGQEDEVVTFGNGKRMETYFEDFHFQRVEKMGYGVPTAEFTNVDAAMSVVSSISAWLFRRFPAGSESNVELIVNRNSKHNAQRTLRG